MKRYKAIAEYYDAEYADMPMLRKDVPFLLSHLSPRQECLELAAGTGRAAIELAKAGHTVVGVDYAADMLAIARRKRATGKISKSRLTFICKDILKLNLNRQFDCVAILFTTFLAFITLEEMDKVLRVVVRHMKPNGIFWLDIFYPNLKLLARDENDRTDHRIFYAPKLKRTVFHTTRISNRQIHKHRQMINFNYDWFDARGKRKHLQIDFPLTWIFPRELKILLERNGLKLVKLYGDYTRGPITAQSKRMIALCSLSPATKRAR